MDYVNQKLIEIDELFKKIGLEPSLYIPTCLSMKIGINNITKEIMEIAPKAQRYDAVELMLDVCVGDKDIKNAYINSFL